VGRVVAGRFHVARRSGISTASGRFFAAHPASGKSGERMVPAPMALD
jgi:hypothetical protein